jgi:tetratricopeptide (TPR) repeat protein
MRPSKLRARAAAKTDPRAAAFVADVAADIRLGRAPVALAKLESERDLVDADVLASHLAGLLHASLGDAARAARHFSCALTLDPRHAPSLQARAVALQSLGDVAGAAADCETLLRLQPKNAEALALQGALCYARNDYESARAAFDKAARLAPNDVGALTGRALALHALARDEDALVDYDRALQLAPQDASLWNNFGVSLLRLQRHDDALAAFSRAVELNRAYLSAYDGAIFALQALGRHPAAIDVCDAALEIRANHVPALFAKANALREMRRREEAVAFYDRALAFARRDAAIWVNRSAVLLELGKRLEAHASALAALSLDAEHALAWRAKGAAELKLGRFETAIASFDKAAEIGGDNADLLCGRGISLKESGRFGDALAAFDAALARDPGHAESSANKGALLMLLGNYADGLPLFEYRWLRDETARANTRLPWPEWRGEDLRDRRIVVLDEAGLGDVLQYWRYLPLMAQEGAHVSYICRPSMRALLDAQREPVTLIDPDRIEGDFDYCVPLCSLPLPFGTRATTIPAPTRYLRAAPERIEKWRTRIGAHGFKIGVAWRGSAIAGADDARSAPLPAFAPLAAIAGVRLISLQKNVGVEQLASLPPSMRVETLGDDFDSGGGAFLDTAAAMEAMDLVVTIDTSIAHLAGALGKECWVALKHVPEWRWMIDRSDNPWYESMRIFRQARREDWDSVFAAMADALEKRHAAAEALRLPGAVGELIDRLTILDIKAEKIADPAKLKNIRHEQALLTAEKARLALADPRFERLESELRAVNLALWNIEDDIRLCEKASDFGATFIALARSVYQQNDRRAALKKDINLLIGSAVIEEKSYAG